MNKDKSVLVVWVFYLGESFPTSWIIDAEANRTGRRLALIRVVRLGEWQALRGRWLPTKRVANDTAKPVSRYKVNK